MSIKLGFVRADTHAYYFGAMMNKFDPLKMQKYNYVCHLYATSIYSPEDVTFPHIDGFEITHVYDKNLKEAEKFSEVFMDKPKVCKELTDMIGEVDAVFVADCDGCGIDHLEFSKPFLEKGITTYVDKPFALTLKDAQEIVRLSKKNNALLFNASILSYVPAAACFKRRFDELKTTYYPIAAKVPGDAVGLGIVKGVGGAFSQELAGRAVAGGLEDRMAYIVHGFSLALNLYGTDVEYVESMGSLPLEYVHMHLKGGREVVIMNTSTDIFPETCSFFASAYGKFGAIHSDHIGDPEFIGGGLEIIRQFKTIIDSGRQLIATEEFIRPIALIEAASVAHYERKRIKISDIWPN